MKINQLNSIKLIKDLFKDIKKNEKEIDKSVSEFDKEWNLWEKKQKKKWNPKKKTP